jgi:hypothetical protein
MAHQRFKANSKKIKKIHLKLLNKKIEKENFAKKTKTFLQFFFCFEFE